MSVRVIPSEDVRVGDLVWFLGVGHHVDRITDHVHPELGPYRVARSDEPAGEWAIALYPGWPPSIQVAA